LQRRQRLNFHGTRFMPTATATSIAVACRHTSKEFVQGTSRVQALRGVELEVRMGELLLLVGPSGCGKTTLLSIVAGILEPTAGDVTVLGQDLSRLSSGAKAIFRSRNIGFVFQQYNLLPALSAAENAAVPLAIAGWPRRKAVQRAAALLTDVGMGHRVDAPPGQLSGGEQQRVAIGRALIHDPRLIVCDEPTAALDAETGHHVMELLRRVAVQPNRAVIVVTHDARVHAFGDRIAHMDDGRIVKIEGA
jgi:putative ABC transport system ATP-binding protein